MFKLLTIAEAAEALATSKSVVYELLQRGDLPYVPVGPSKAYRIDARDLDAYIERRKVQHSVPAPSRPRPRLKHIRLS